MLFVFKVKEIRNRGDETARLLIAHLQEGQEPPATLRHDFEELLHVVLTVYISLIIKLLLIFSSFVKMIGRSYILILVNF